MAKKELSSLLWIEEFRPETIKGMVLPKKFKNYFTRLVTAGEIKNLLLHSNSPGTGKTTLSKAICNDIGADYLYINASERTGIDTIRTDVKKFATVKSFSGKPKIVILDEIDSNSNEAMQKALRAFMEQFYKSCRFILTCNYLTKVIEPLQSRCEIIDFNMCDSKTVEEMKPKIFKRITKILKYKKVEYEEDTITKIIDYHYPDQRFILKICSQFADTYDCINDEIFSTQLIDDEFYELVLSGNFNKSRKYLIQKNVNYDEMYVLLYKNLLKKIDNTKKAQAIHIINEGQKWSSLCIDKSINFEDTLLSLMEECL
jgi:replication factor C small subunit